LGIAVVIQPVIRVPTRNRSWAEGEVEDALALLGRQVVIELLEVDT